MNAGWFLLALACLGATCGRRRGGTLRFGLGDIAQVARALGCRWKRAGGRRNRTRARRHYLLARSGRSRRSPGLRFFGLGESQTRRSRFFRAPKRIAETDGSEAFGYERATLFPIVVEALDPKRPVTLSLALDYAVCEKICLPARAKFALELSSGAATPFSGEVAAALARAPQRVEVCCDRRRCRRARCEPMAAVSARQFGQQTRSLRRAASRLLDDHGRRGGRIGARLFFDHPARAPLRCGLSNFCHGHDRRRAAGAGDVAASGAQA